jgi:hypothetical protein
MDNLDDCTRRRPVCPTHRFVKSRFEQKPPFVHNPPSVLPEGLLCCFLTAAEIPDDLLPISKFEEIGPL